MYNYYIHCYHITAKAYESGSVKQTVHDYTQAIGGVTNHGRELDIFPLVCDHLRYDFYSKPPLSISFTGSLFVLWSI